MNALEFIHDKFNVDRVKELVEKEINYVASNHDDISDGIYILDIVSGSYGRYQQSTIAEFFGIELDESGIADTHDFIEEVAEKLTELIKDLGPGRMYFGYLEADNSFGLFYKE